MFMPTTLLQMCLNPCSNGMKIEYNSESAWMAHDGVLILILME